jgi:hypothetical protein
MSHVAYENQRKQHHFTSHYPCLLIPSSERMVAESTLDKVVIAYGRSGQTISNATNPLNLQDIPTKKNPCR